MNKLVDEIKKEFKNVKKEFDILEEYLRKNQNKIQSEIIGEVHYFIKDIREDITEIQDEIHTIQEEIRDFPELLHKIKEDIEDIKEDIEGIHKEIEDIYLEINPNNYNDKLKQKYYLHKLDRERLEKRNCKK